MHGSRHRDRQPLRRAIAEQDLRTLAEPVHGEVAANALERGAVMGAGCALPALQPRPQRLVERLGDVGAGQVARQNQAQRHRELQLQQAV